VTLAAGEHVATVPLALWDFVPVLLGGLGCWLLAELAGRRVPTVRAAGMVGAALVFAGGLAKAGWKLVFALDGTDLTVLYDGLFVLLAPGFVLVALSLLAARSGRPRWFRVGLTAVLASYGLAAAVGSVDAVLPLMVVAATATGVLALLEARSLGDSTAAWLFGVQIALAFALVPLAAPPQTLGKQWAEETMNAVAQGAFAYAAWRLLRRARLTTSPAAPAREEVPA
jgi:hypothetical protein